MWGQLQFKGCELLAANALLSPEMRLLFLVFAKAGPGAHTYFGSKGPQLAKIDKNTGEHKGMYSRRHMQKLLNKGIAAGLYEPQSTLRCVVLSARLYKYALPYGPRSCPEHGHNYVSAEGQWLENEAFAEAS